MSLSSRQKHRRFTWLCGSEDSVEVRLCAHLVQTHPPLLTVLISDRSRAGLTAVNARQAFEWLGRETDCVIFDAFAGFNPNAFAQVCGTLKGGGELIVLSPPAADWPFFVDPEYATLRGSRFHDYVFPGHFIQRCVREMHDFPRSNFLTCPQAQSCAAPFFSEQQAAVVTALATQFAEGMTSCVVTADRGRGKTTALGLALSCIAQNSFRTPLMVVVTAPSRHALDALFSALVRQLPEGHVRGSGFEHPLLIVRFYPPVVLLEKKPSADVVIVDEAAAISVTLLKAIHTHWPCHWYATTLHGYEGNGRGFELRFLTWLQQQSSAYQHYSLSQPVRWAAGDPLEDLSYRLLLLDAEIPSMQNEKVSQITTSTIRQADLVQQEALLRQIFGLLVVAHYRTTPNDLRQLLDSPDLQIRVLCQQSVVVAVALLVEEGPLPDTLIEPVWGGYRRPSGDLIPQTLVSREGCRAAGALKGWRVMRIAVHPDRQRQGLGGQLLRAIEQEADELGLDFCAASFAADSEVFAFWRSLDYRPLRLGERSDRVTAGWPMLVFKGLSLPAQQICTEVQRQCAQRLALRLMQLNDPHDESMLLHCFASFSFETTLSARDREAVQGFAWHQRSLDDSILALRQWLMTPKTVRAVLSCSEADQALMIGRIWKQHPADTLSKITALNGKRQQLNRLRLLCGELLKDE